MTSDSKNLEKVRGLLQLIDSGINQPEVIDSLHEIIRDDPEASQFYIRQMHLRASLWWHLTDESQNSTEDVVSYSSLPAEPVRIVFRRRFFLVGMVIILALVVGLFSHFLVSSLNPHIQIVGVVKKSVDVVWEPNRRTWPEKAKIFSGDQLHIQRGVIEIELISGTNLILEGPAIFTAVNSEKVKLHTGHLFAHVPPESTGFIVETPSSRILDLGTEFGVAVSQTGITDVHVIKGRLEVDPLGTSGSLKESRLLTIGNAIRVQKNSPRIDDIHFCPEIFTKELNYKSVIQDSEPFVYFQFNHLENEIVKNQVGDHHHLQLVGDVRLHGEGTEKTLRFGKPKRITYAVLTDPVSDLITEDYTFELWVRPSAVKHSTLVAIKYLNGNKKNTYNGRDVGLLELLDYRKPWYGRQAGLRWMLRFPPTMDVQDGGNVFSDFKYQPGQWYHIVGVRSGEELRAYVNGEFQGTVKYTVKTRETVEILIGRDFSKEDKSEKGMKFRNFIGEIDEFLIYRRALTDKEIQNHYRLFQPN